jgi:membrane protein implicated in regulation of membrane protease activity
MTWEGFYLLCFGVGLAFSVLAFVSGLGHLHLGGHFPIAHVGHGISLGHLHGGSHLVGRGGFGQSLSFWNGFTMAAFLCWFGGAGYLLTKFGGFLISVVLLFATLSGVIGGALIFLFLARIVTPHEHELTAEETAMPGVVARVSAAIRAEGVGEIVFPQLGALCSSPARAEDGGRIEKDEEVYVLRYEGGIAYVRRWEDLPITDFKQVM